jgi:putative ABC transport system permease protein
MALGALRYEIVISVVREGMRLAMVGIGAGLLAAEGLTRLMSSLLYDVKPNDARTFGALVFGMAAAALAARCAPVLRAARVDPAIVLRGE